MALALDALGFGTRLLLARVPLLLEMGRVVEEGDWAGRFVEIEPWGIMFQTREAGDWKDSDSFDLSRVTPADIRAANHETSTTVRHT